MRSPAINHIQRALSDNFPQILSAAAIAGVVGTVVLAVKATPHALADIEHAKENKQIDTDLANLEEFPRVVTLSKREIVEATWRVYIPATACGIATIACIVGSNAVGLRRNAALLGAYTLVDTSFREYKDKVIEHVTQQKAQKIDDEIMADKIAANPPKTETIIVTGGGDQLCYESLTGRYFKSTAEKIRRSAQDIDARILQGDAYASLNEFFDELGLDHTSMGSLMGWNIECRLKVVFSSHITEGEQAALAVGYEKLPTYQFDKF